MNSPPAPVVPARHEQHTLAALLGLLHLVIWWDFGSGTSRSLMLAHIGLFLLWQPILSHQLRLTWRALAAFSVVALVFVSALSWLLLGFWLLVLIGLVGGRVNLPRRQRFAYLIALVHLVLEFLIGWVPRMFPMDAPASDFVELFRFGLFVPPLVLFFIRSGPRPDPAPGLPTIDFIYGLAMSMLSLVVALGSLVSTFATGTAYPLALTHSVMAIAVFLLSVAWLWGPMAGFSGFGQLWERYVQNAGTPFELWLADLQRAAQNADSAEHFLDLALNRLLSLRWVTGLEWRVGDRGGSLGEITSNKVFRSRSGELRIIIYSHRRLGTALMLHARLLTQLIGHFYRAKEAEREFTRQAHLRAVYQTGARMTHDIKNLLQALRAITSAVEQTERHNAEATTALLQRQLPLITQRLQLSLDKLTAPVVVTTAHDETMQDADAWWQTLVTRNAGQDIDFVNELEHARAIPVELFDTVAENLIENARFKRQTQAGIRITVRLHGDDQRIALQVSDDGSPIADEIKHSLFSGPMESASGLGIGLYQAARLAQDMGYQLALAERTDLVVFELRADAAAAR